MDLIKRISVLMGIYNCESTLSGSIESVLCQTYTNLDLIIHDDGSVDSTVDSTILLHQVTEKH